MSQRRLEADHRAPTRPRLALGLALTILTLAGGCKQTGPRPEGAGTVASETSEEELLTRGRELLEQGKLADARAYLRRYEQRYPRGGQIEQVKLMIGDTFFRASEPDQKAEGVALYKQFLTFYPKHALACTAQFRIAEFHYDQRRACERDQAETHQAVEELQKLLAAYPECELAEQARERLQDCHDRLACAEMRVAEFYRKTGEAVAAEHRLSDLLATYPAFAGRCDAVGRHVELLHQLGFGDMANVTLMQMEADCAGHKELPRLRKLVGAAPARPAAAPAPPAPATSARS